MLVTDFKKKQGYAYSDIFLDSLPDTCLDSRCNSPMEMTEVLTSLHCSNPRCPTKIARRLLAMSTMLGVKDMGSARANDFISKFGIDNPLQVFAYEPEVDGEMGNSISMDVSLRIANQFRAKNSFTLWEYVRLANLPFIQSSALQIFGDYDDLAKAYEDIEKAGVDFIRLKLNISTTTNKTVNDTNDISIRALRIYDSLMTFKTDLFDMLPYVKIIKIHSGNIKIIKAVCSEEVGSPFRTKADFYASVNNTFSNKIHVEFLSSVTRGIDYLVWAGADGMTPARVTNKVQKVRRYNDIYNQHMQDGILKDNEHYIPILTANEFIEELNKEVLKLGINTGVSTETD